MCEVTGYLELMRSDGLPNACKKIELKGKQVTIGRGIGNSVIFESLQVSRQHAALQFVSPNWMIKDTSTNGILVNGEQVPRNKWFALKDDDVISLIRTGALQYKFRPVLKGTASQKLTRSGASRGTAIIDDDDSSPTCSKYSKRKASPSRCSDPYKLENKRTRLERGRSKTKFDSDDEDDEVAFICESPSKSQQKDSIGAVRKSATAGSSSSINSSKGVAEKKHDSDVARKLEYYENRLDEVEREKALIMRELIDVRKELEVANSQQRTCEEGIQRDLTESVETEFSCVICNDVFVNATVTNCGHTFCSYCISECVKVKPECPTCRRPLTSREKNFAVESVLAKLIPLLSKECQDKREEAVREREATEARERRAAEEAAAAVARATVRGGRGRGRGRGARGRRARQVGGRGGGGGDDDVQEVGGIQFNVHMRLLDDLRSVSLLVGQLGDVLAFDSD